MVLVVLENTLESPLDCKEIQPVHPKGDQYWVFIVRTRPAVTQTARPQGSHLPPPSLKPAVSQWAWCVQDTAPDTGTASLDASSGTAAC